MRSCRTRSIVWLAVGAVLMGWSQQALAVSVADFQKVVDAYLAERREPERITGVSAYVGLGDPGPAIEIFAGDDLQERRRAGLRRHAL